MAFDLDAYRAAHEPWSFTARGRTFVARHVSTPQVQRYERMMKAATTERARLRAVWLLLRYAFPWRLSYLVGGDPVRIILTQLDPLAQHEALADFFACQRGEKRSPQTTTATSGPRSPAPTPHRTR